MSAKLTPSSNQENPNLRKQIGCMNGIFQLFDRHHFLTSRRLCNHNHKKLLSGPNHTAELKNAMPEAAVRNRKELSAEKHRSSTESSRISSSSSFSSTDYDSTVQTERTPSSQHSFTETQAQSTLIQQHQSSAPMAHPSLELRDVVKDSMYRESRGLLIKTVGKEGEGSYMMKRIDSPRPLQGSRTLETRVTGVDGSARAFAKNQEAPIISKQEKDGLLRWGLKEPSRFSYDGREWRDGAKCTIKLKEPPRLSLDGRDIRSRVCDLQSTSLQSVLSGDQGNCSHIQNLNQEPASNNRSSIIAKLMGLETFPHHVSTNQDKLVTRERSTSRSSYTADKCRQNQDPMSPQVLKKGPASPRPSKSHCVKKPTSQSRFPIEQAPWRQKDRAPHNLVVKSRLVPPNASHASTVYGEIEKRITGLEFKGYGKDLRALKQILEAMQKTRQKLENQIAEEADLESQTNRCSRENSSCVQEFKPGLLQNQQSNCLALNIKGNRPPNMPESPTISMKPVKLVDKFNPPPLRAADLSPSQRLQTRDAKHNRVDLMDNRITRKQRPMRSNLQDPGWPFLSLDDKKEGKSSTAIQISKEIKHKKGEYLTAPGKKSGDKSPRPQQKQCGIDNQSRSNTPFSDLHRARMQSNKTQAESGPQSRKLKVMSTNLQRCDDQASKLNPEMRSSCYHQDDTASLQSESNNSLVSQMDTDITSTDCSKSETKQLRECNDNDAALQLRQGIQIADLTISTAEQPSPVSVLDATFYREDSPSPVKKISTAFTDEAEWSSGSLDNRQKIRSLTIGSEVNNKKLEDMKDLDHKLQLLSPRSNEARTDCIGSPRNMSSPDHRYITKVLLASGLLKDVSFTSIPIPVHSPGHVINPNLFHVLERTEGQDEPMWEEFDRKTIQLMLNQNVHRKILFDTVNEILSCKLSSENCFLLQRRTHSGQELLKQLHSEVDNLQTISNCTLEDEEDQLLGILNADMTHKLEDWRHHHSEVPALVLDIERLIFKDLISEFIKDEIANHQIWQREHCGQLLNE